MHVKKGDILKKTHPNTSRYLRYLVICADEEYAVLACLYKTITEKWVCTQIVNGHCDVINNNEAECTLEGQGLEIVKEGAEYEVNPNF